MSERLDVLGVGEISLDQVARLPRFPPFGAKLAVLSWTEHAGGQVATAILTCARLGLRAAFIGCVGDDSEAERCLRPLEKAGVDVGDVRVRPGVRSQGAMVLVDEGTGERTVLSHRPPALSLSPAELSPARLDATRLLLADAGDPELVAWAARRVRERGCPVVLDADTPGAEVRSLLGAVDYPIVPEGFARETFGTDRPEEALTAMAREGARMPIITRGAAGAMGLAKDRLIQVPGFQVPVADTTGAGDVFHGAFAWAVVRGLSPEGCLRAANAAAGMSCRAAGAQGGIPDVSSLRAFLAAQGQPMEEGGR